MTRQAEQHRLDQARRGQPWKRWGPYLSERQWGTVREDYSQDGSAWDFFPHDHARSRAYQWGEDGLAGVSDDRQLLCFSIGLWNGADPIMKERLFGLTNAEGNHGEDVKEYYYYLDNTPTHSWMKYLYRYPQGAFPYADLVRINGERGREDFEYELIDTGLFDEDRYFDVFVEYAKENPEELLIKITAFNRGPDLALLHLLPTLWFRNTWSWGDPTPRPSMKRVADHDGNPVVVAEHPLLGERWFIADGAPQVLFTDNDTNSEKLFGQPNQSPWVKDAFHRFVLDRDVAAVNPAERGTKAAAHYQFEIAPGEFATVCLRLSDHTPMKRWGRLFGKDFDKVFSARQTEADIFYASVIPANVDSDTANIMRQALAGMLWTKQFYYYDVGRWLKGHGVPLTGVIPSKGPLPRNLQWNHMLNADLISMPDKWEYPWYAAWDLGFHTVSLGMVDADFAKDQLELILRERYLHPNGQIPAYEWNFADVNPPVHAWASLFLYKTELAVTGKGDIAFLKRVFDKLILNFTWWVNRKDRDGRNVFEGGFLGLDNIGVFDRSAPLPTGGHLEQADGTAWMALYSQTMFQISLELAVHDPVYEDMVVKFFEHFVWIAASMDHVGEGDEELWDEDDGFFYDVLRFPDGRSQRLKVRSLVGLLPLCASTVIEPAQITRFEKLKGRMRWIIEERPELLKTIAPPEKPGESDRHLLSALDATKLRRVLARMLDESEFLGPFGIRSVSKYHDEQPFSVDVNGQTFSVDYQPAESESGLFGGNSNWRGPVWMPVNALIIRALLNLHLYYGESFRVECPTGSGQMMTLFEIAREVSDRLARTFLRDAHGHRPVFGGAKKFQEDPLWRDHILFYEYFHGDNGAGLGASHQTGWTGLIARMMHLFATTDPEGTNERYQQVAGTGR
ncbi:MAG TPA: hypothetical protein VJ781_12175 [Pyrinomonadaceae bacterium]|nr:hypothetical protein [Pyrinomonadaceae bacterium]